MKSLISAILAAGISSAAFAAITFDPVTGVGFVGKGDVQLAFGWNNATLQTSAAGVSFFYDTSVAYDIECEWTTETGGKNSKIIHHAVTLHRSTEVASSVTYDARTNRQGQLTGFDLLGLGTATTSGQPIPQVGDACLGENDNEREVGNSAVVTAVVVDTSAGGLFVSYGGVDVLLL